MSEEELTKNFIKHGFKNATAKRLARLFLYACGNGVLDSWEMKRWRELNVLDGEGRILVLSDEDERSDLFWVMLGLVWEGLVKRSFN